VGLGVVVDGEERAVAEKGDAGRGGRVGVKVPMLMDGSPGDCWIERNYMDGLD